MTEYEEVQAVATDVFDLLAKISLDTTSYKQGLESAQSDMSSFGSALSSGFATVAKAGVEALAATADAAISVSKTFVDGVSNVASYGDNIDKMSQKMGISAEAYQEWDAVMQHSGATIESLKPSMKTLALQAEKNSNAFQKLGISQEEVATLSQEDLFSKTIEGLQKMEEGSERTALASTLLGRGATELGALLNTSAEETQKMKNRVHELGGVMSDEAVKNAAAFQDQLQDMQTAFQSLGRNMLSEFMPSLKDVMGGLTELFTGNSDEGFKQINKGIDDLLNGLADKAPKVLEAGAKFTGKLVAGIAKKAPDIVKAGINIAKILGQTLAEQAPDILKSLLTGIAGEEKGNELFSFLTDTFYKFAPIFEKAGNIIGEDIGKIFNSMSDLGKRLDLDKVLSSLGNAFENFLPLLDDAGDRIAWLFENVLSPVIEWAVNDFAPVAIDALAEAFRALKEVGEMLEPIATAVWQEFLQPLAEWTGDAAIIALGWLKDGLKAFADEFDGIDWAGYWEDIDNFGENWTTGMEAIGQGLTDNEKAIEAFFDTSKFGSGWRNFWEKVGGAIYDVGEKAETAGGYIFDFKEGWSDLYEEVGSKIFDFKEKWVETFEAVGGIIATVIGKIEDIGTTIKDLIGNAYQWGFDLITAFSNGIGEGLTYLEQSVEDVGGIIYDMLHHSHPDKGLLADDYKWMPDMMEMFAQGISDNADKPQTAIENMLDGIRSSFMDVQPAYTSYSTMQGVSAATDSGNNTVILQLVDGAYNTIARGTVNAINFLQGQAMSVEMRGRQL